MAYWGMAMSQWYPLWYPPTPESLKAGSEAVEQALAAGPKTDREKDYIGAIGAFYRDSDKLDHRTRAVAYEKAMEQVNQRYPDDREGGVFYAHALHMPSHIFTRLGLWQQSIESNNLAHNAALAYVQKSHGPGAYDGETVHTMDYMEYAYLQLGQDGKAKQVLDELTGYRQTAGA